MIRSTLAPIALAIALLLPCSAAAQTDGYISADGVEIYYHTYGEGTPLLVLNGGPGVASGHFVGLARQLAGLDAGYKAILFDQRGTGASDLEDVDRTTVTIDQMVQDIEALRRHLGFESWTVLGHSWGGMYAMLYASKHPERINGLILSASGGMTLEWLEYAGDNIRMRLGPERREEYDYWSDPENVRSDPDRASLERVKAMAAAYVFNPEHIPFVVEALTAPGANFPAVRGLVYADLRRTNYDLRDDLSGFEKPVLILHGRQDILGEMVPYQTHQHLPNSQLVWIERCSHYPWLDNPDVYFDSIDDFLTSLSSDQGSTE